MLIITGVMLGFVLVVMVGESVQEMQLAGLAAHDLDRHRPPGVDGAVVRDLPDRRGARSAGAGRRARRRLVCLARELKVHRPRRRGLQAAMRPEQPPAQPAGAPVHAPAVM